MEPNVAVANAELRGLVEKFKRHGLPKPVPFREAESALTEEEGELLAEFPGLGELERSVAVEGQKPKPGSEWWQIREKARTKFQQAVLLAGLARLRLIQEYSIEYGAIPNPKEGWKYYLLPDLSYACWQCGREVLAKRVRFSVHFAEFSGPVGGGEVVTKLVPYCPACEPEPPDTDIIRETVAQTLAREAGGFLP